MIELGQIRHSPPAVVTAVLALGRIRLHRPAVHMEPIPVWGVLAVFHQVMKRPEAAAAVVEHTIEHQPHAPLV